MLKVQNTGACSLRGTCPKCGGNIVLTVHEGSVRKYLEMRSLFESDKVKQKGLADFM